MSDPAHMLFPNDAPKSQQPPTGGGSAPVLRSPVATVIEPGKVAEPATPAGPAAKSDGAASVLFKDDAVDHGAKAVTEILDGFANSAISDGDGGERSRSIELARDGLLADAKAHGLDTAELSEAMAVVKERQADSITEPTPEQAEQRMTEALDVCRAEGITDVDLGLARRFIADLEVVSPGTAATLERSGAGNDLRLIRAAIKEARRRGYGR